MPGYLKYFYDLGIRYFEWERKRRVLNSKSAIGLVSFGYKTHFSENYRLQDNDY
ncbi:MAG: hypothetical protein M2R45_00984 [Verrucomicrobia subdivision 3 bacterium]|nr:hypothetical protein [Limisphaerales bacterium]MCS1414651.1 hypothetical protein [Limisphaerales bacterium]